MTKIQITPSYRDVKPKGFYVYIHRRATDGAEFYVGKGSTNRGWHRSRGAFWRNVACKYGVLVDVVQEGMTEHDAHTLEMWLIAKLRRAGCRLVNITDGGEGASGVVSKKRIKVYCSSGMDFPSYEHAVSWLIHNGHPRASSSIIARCVNGGKNTAYGYAWWKEGQPEKTYTCPKSASAAKRKRPVVNSAEDWFDSLASAAKWCRENGNPNAREGGIGACLSKRTRSAYGFGWKYADPPP